MGRSRTMIDEFLVDELSETQTLSLGDVACLGHPLLDTINRTLDLEEFDTGLGGLIHLALPREPVLH